MAEEAKDFGAIGEEILFAARNELYMNLPYLDVALCGLRFAPGDEVTLSIATDGQTLYYSGSWLAERYLRSRVLTNRAYLHVILHCMLRHLAKKRGKAAELWDLACDVAVESILSELDYSCLDEGTVPMKQKFFGECRQEMPVLTAEGIYRYLLRRDLGQREAQLLEDYRARLRREEITVPAEEMDALREWFAAEVEQRRAQGAQTGEQFDNTFRFLEEALEQSQELVIFVTEVTAGYDTSWFVENFGCEAYFRHNRELLFDDTRHRIREEIAAAKAAQKEEQT